MSLSKIDVVFKDNNASIFNICRLALANNNIDLTFIDKSADFFHISIHRDGNVFLTPQKGWKYLKKSKWLFKFNWDLLDLELLKEKPLLMYFPGLAEMYPIQGKFKRGSATYILEKGDTSNYSLNYFIINQKTKKPKGRIQDLGLNISRTETTHPDGTIVSEDKTLVDPYFAFKNHKIRFFVRNINRPKEVVKYRFLFLFQPSHEIDVQNFLNQYELEVDIDEVNNNRYCLRKYELNTGVEIIQLVY